MSKYYLVRMVYAYQETLAERVYGQLAKAVIF